MSVADGVFRVVFDVPRVTTPGNNVVAEVLDVDLVFELFIVDVAGVVNADTGGRDSNMVPVVGFRPHEM